MKRKVFFMTAVTFGMATMLAAVPVMAQQVNGVLGSPSATMSIDGKQLPAPDSKF